MPQPDNAQQSHAAGSVMARKDRAGAARLRPATFSTDAFEARHRFDAWSAEFGTLNDITLPREDRACFEASCAAWRFGGFAIAASATPAMGMSRRSLHAARDGLDHWVLRVARTGSVRTRLGDARFETQARQLVAYSVADGFEGEWSAAEWVTLWIPRDSSSTLASRLSLRPTGPQAGVAAALLADFLLSLPDHIAQAQVGEEDAIIAAITALVSASLPADASTLDRRRAEGAGNPLLYERVRRVIRENVGSARLTPERIARAAGVSRSALYRMMEAEGGVAHHVQRIRLDLVRAALSDPRHCARSIASLAEEYGFHDASAFARAFRRAYGCTPSDMRNADLLGMRWHAAHEPQAPHGAWPAPLPGRNSGQAAAGTGRQWGPQSGPNRAKGGQEGGALSALLRSLAISGPG